LLQNKPCIVTLIIFVVIPLLTGSVLFDVQGVLAERAAGVVTVFQTNLVNPQVTTTNPTTAATTGVHMSSGYDTANQANTVDTNHKVVSSTTTVHNTASVIGAFFQTTGKTTTNRAKTNNADVLFANNRGVSSTTTTHNTANNDAAFGAFFQTEGKTTTNTAKTNNADIAKQTATTSTRHAHPTSTSTADPTSTTASTIAHPVSDPSVSLGAPRFTLIEVVIPVVILGIIVAVPIPQFIDLTTCVASSSFPCTP
jgi:hypothetical protein